MIHMMPDIIKNDMICVAHTPGIRPGGIYQALSRSYYNEKTQSNGCLLRNVNTGQVIHMKRFTFQFIRHDLKVRSV